MNILKKSVLYASIVCTLALLSSCEKELDLGADDVKLRVGETVTVEVKHAGKNCTAETDNPNVITATVKDGNLELHATDEGTTTVRLTNAENESVNLTVVAALDLKNAVWVIKTDDRPDVVVYAYTEDMYLGASLWDMLEKDLPFSVGKRYTFVEEGGKKPSTWDDIAGIPYRFDDGLLTAESENGEAHTCTIIRRTDDSMITQEDLTEHFRALYPDAGVTDVKRNITWTRYMPY